MNDILINNIRVLIVYFLFVVVFILISKNSSVTDSNSINVVLQTEIPSSISQTKVAGRAENKPNTTEPNLLNTQEKSVVTKQKIQENSQDLFSQLVNHNNPSDCWIAYRGHIYNITSYFGKHPGGDAALSRYCGQDATLGFDTKDTNPPNPHSVTAQSMLYGYLIQ